MMFNQKEKERAMMEIDQLIDDAKSKEEKAPNKYRMLIDYARGSKLTKTEISKQLQRKEIPQGRASEILRVAFGPSDIYRRFKRGTIGFRRALAEVIEHDQSPREREEKIAFQLVSHLRKAGRFADAHAKKFQDGKVEIKSDHFRVVVEKIGPVNGKHK